MMMYRNRTARPPEASAARVAERRAPVIPVRCATVLAAACLAAALQPAPAAAIQTLEAADHAELEAAVSATGVSRVALADDRIRRVIRSPGGFDVEHDAASGDLYLRPLEALDPMSDERPGAALPITLFLGTERGFTYRLTLTPDARSSAQVLIRNAAAASGPAAPGHGRPCARRQGRGAGPAGPGRGAPRDPARLPG